MSLNRLLLAAAFGFTASAAFAGPVATGNAAGGAITIVTPVPLLTTPEAAAPTTAPVAQAATPAPAPAPAQSGFISGYVASFGR